MEQKLYAHSLALLTDLYQITMAYGYWKNGMAGREAVFNLGFRRNPFKGGFAVACGLGTAIEYLKSQHFTGADVAYLASLKGNDGHPLFEGAFLDYLAEMRFTCDIDAIPEGTVVFPHEPLIRVRGPLLQCQIVETPLLNIVNFQTLVATKAARICQAARGMPVIEFGLRRAQGTDGGLAASRACFVGGCTATSNLLAGKLYGIPVRGTHAHSWVMSFDSEREAFKAYSAVMPNNCVFLVDTYDTLEGVKNAIDAGVTLRKAGYELGGIRLDSGDLAYLSIEARKLLDAAGFPKAAIVASNDLDEHTINSLIEQGARIDTWGVGTHLVTAFEEPALGGVYKLAALRGEDGEWKYKIKLSEQVIKISTPGILQIRRFSKPPEDLQPRQFIADMIYEEGLGPESRVVIDPVDMTLRHKIPAAATFEDLLVPVFRGGRIVYDPPSLDVSRKRTQDQLGSFYSGVKRLVNPHKYTAGLDDKLFDLKTKLILKARGTAE